MRREIIFILLSCVFSSYVFSADLRLINMEKIENRSAYSQELTYLLDNQAYLEGFISDEDWNGKYSKDEYRKRLQEILKILQSYQENENQEYVLLKAAVCEYLFFLDVPEYYQKAVDTYSEIGTLAVQDYRYKWFLGLLYAKAAMPFQAIGEFDYVLDIIPKDQVHPSLIADYAYALTLAMMPEQALENYDVYFSLTGNEAGKESLYTALKNKFIAYKAEEGIEFNKLYQVLERPKSYGLFSRFLGLWIPLPTGWTLNYSGFKNGASTVKLSSEKITHTSGEQLSYSILVFSSDDSGEREAALKKTLPNLKPVDLGLGPDYESYEYSDKNTYTQFGGGHGYLTIVRSAYSDKSGIHIEAPAQNLPADISGGVNYGPLDTEYTRYPGKLTHFILLDTCNFVFAESKEQYLSLLKDARFE